MEAPAGWRGLIPPPPSCPEYKKQTPHPPLSPEGRGVR